VQKLYLGFKKIAFRFLTNLPEWVNFLNNKAIF
jgi:hypothetical protein